MKFDTDFVIFNSCYLSGLQEAHEQASTGICCICTALMYLSFAGMLVLANNKHLCPVCSQSALSASSEALATVTGIVDGTGSVGAAIGQVTENTQHFLRKKKQVDAVVSGS